MQAKFMCGAKGCEERAGLHSFEVNFGYLEAGEKKQALVKLRVCPKHGTQLNYRKEKEMQRRQREEAREHRRKRMRQEKRRKTRDSDSCSESSGDEGDREEVDDRSGRATEGGDVGRQTAPGDEGPQEEGRTRCKEERSRAQEGAPCDVDLEGNARGGGLDGSSIDRPAAGVNVWAAKPPEVELTRDDEFDQYFQDLLL